MKYDRISKSIEVIQKLRNPDIEIDQINYQRILESLILLQQAVVDSKIKLPDWKNWIDVLTSKFIIHSNSILNLSKGSQLKIPTLRKDLKLIDIPSILIIIRAQIECFLMFDFIYSQPNTEEEKEFRYWNWKYDNLLMRNKIPPKTEIIINQQKDDLKEISELKHLIESSNFLKKFSKKQSKQILEDGNSRLFHSWDDIIVKAELEPKLFHGLYPILSSFAHTGSHSVMNLKDQKLGYHKNHRECHIYLFLSILITCLFIFRYIKMFKSAEIKYNLLPYDLRLELETLHNYASKKKILFNL